MGEETMKPRPWGGELNNLYLKGGVCTGSKPIRQRARDIARALAARKPEEEFNAESDLQFYTVDAYGKADGDTVSIEVAAERVLKIQEGLDREIIAENQGVDGDQLRKKGLAPCKRAGLED